LILNYWGAPTAQAGGTGNGYVDIETVEIACVGATPLPLIIPGNENGGGVGVFATETGSPSATQDESDSPSGDDGGDDGGYDGPG
jgi:hypothetical protein